METLGPRCFSGVLDYLLLLYVPGGNKATTQARVPGMSGWFEKNRGQSQCPCAA